MSITYLLYVCSIYVRCFSLDSQCSDLFDGSTKERTSDRVYVAIAARDDMEECQEARKGGEGGGHEAGRGEEEFLGVVKKGRWMRLLYTD